MNENITDSETQSQGNIRSDVSHYIHTCDSDTHTGLTQAVAGDECGEPGHIGEG